MIISSLLAAEGLAQLGCSLGAGIAVIGAGLGIWQNPDKHDSYICFRRGLCIVRNRSLCLPYRINFFREKVIIKRC